MHVRRLRNDNSWRWYTPSGWWRQFGLRQQLSSAGSGEHPRHRRSSSNSSQELALPVEWSALTAPFASSSEDWDSKSFLCSCQKKTFVCGGQGSAGHSWARQPLSSSVWTEHKWSPGNNWEVTSSQVRNHKHVRDCSGLPSSVNLNLLKSAIGLTLLSSMAPKEYHFSGWRYQVVFWPSIMSFLKNAYYVHGI
jgi:hypothetical protein